MTLITLKSIGFIRRVDIVSQTLPSVKKTPFKCYIYSFAVKIKLFRVKKSLTSGDKGIDVLNLTNGRMITITNNVKDAVNQTIDVDN